MAQNKLLTIVIPTYNRSNKLTRLLAHLETEIKGNEHFVDVLITDNHSTDGTDQAIQEFLERNTDWQVISSPFKHGYGPKFSCWFSEQ